ncbi:MAG: acyl-ACP--UDP-N-acetylglucosamine O-acyltransferase [Planctomycetaceae bacterium]|nr:acyl-ACP--UDP-N-acetylglucosamine O-acyltransferase [Planctomycetaceae bacterium]
MPEALVHPTAVISEQAKIADDVTIGPYAVIGPNVAIASGCAIGSHACIDGTTTIGERTRVGRHACIGADPQDLGYKGEETFLHIGPDNFFGDYVQISRGTLKSHDRSTRIGAQNFFMAYAHIGHDCIVGNKIIIANTVQVAGHVEIEDNVYIGGLTAIHQFVRIGRFAMVAGGSATSLDIPPYVRVAGYGCAVYGLNLIGLKRSNTFSKEAMANIKMLYDRFFRDGGQFEEVLDGLARDFPNDPNVMHFVAFVRKSERGVTRVRDTKE